MRSDVGGYDIDFVREPAVITTTHPSVTLPPHTTGRKIPILSPARPFASNAAASCVRALALELELGIQRRLELLRRLISLFLRLGGT